MTAVAVAPLGRIETVQWLSPAPVWDSQTVGVAASGLTQPWIAELDTDSFIDDFLAMLASSGNTTPAALATMAPEVTTDGQPNSPYRLFQPLSQRYYLVSATLATRRPGIPDHALRADKGEEVHFVIRRLTAAGEQAFVPDASGGTWRDVQPGAYVADENRYPLHRAPVTPYAEPGTTTAALGLDRCCGAGRTLWFGYVPVGLEKTLTRPMADPAAQVQALASQPYFGMPVALDWLYQRVILPWRQLTGGANPPTPAAIAYGSLYTLLELGAWLQEHLEDTYNQLGSATPGTDGYGVLAQHLQSNTIRATTGDTTALISIAQAVLDTATFAPMLHGDNSNVPSTSYDLTTLSYGSDWLADPVNASSLAALARNALNIANRQAPLPPELEDVIREVPPAAPSSGGSVPNGGPVYVIRFVDTWDPCCVAVSAPTHAFQLAGALDADAPARKVVIRMPDLGDLRSFKRGVAIESPPSLQRVLNAVTPGILKGDKMAPNNGLQLGMICSYSIPIITLVAFIVMFIFLILLNIVFWWLPFLKICFPVPIPPAQPKGPTTP